MSYNKLNITSKKSGNRVGRGISAGQGKTAGRGTKGQKARTGFSLRPGFEGGQNPLMQRFPKLRGFKSFKTKPEVVQISDLDKFGVNVDNFVLAEAGLISSPYVKVKLIANGEVTKKHTVSLQAASATAEAAVKKAGGEFKQVPRIGEPKKTENTKSK